MQNKDGLNNLVVSLLSGCLYVRHCIAACTVDVCRYLYFIKFRK